MLGTLQPGDRLLVSELSRLGRSLSQVIQIVETLVRRKIDPGLDELVDREAAFLAELEERQFLVGEVLRTSRDAEVSDSFQGGVQAKVKWGLFRTVKDYSIQNIV